MGILFFPAFSAFASVSDLVISEVLPNPIGDESQNEFIEIYNSGIEEIDLGGLFLDDIDGGSTPFLIPFGTKLSVGGYLTFYSKDSGISLTNTGERVRILNTNKTVLTEVIYGNATENYSYVRQSDGTYVWVTPPMPENVFIAPIVIPTPTPDPTASPTIVPSSTPSIGPTLTPTPDYSSAKNLVINEVLPNPKGNDSENEFIEIYNPGGSAVNLSGFYVDDAEGGSTPYKIPDGTVIEAGGYLVFYSRDSKLTLNNTGDSARLLYPDKSLLIGKDFGKSPKEDWSYARKADGNYEWTTEPTPGEENEIVVEVEETPTPSPTASPKPSATPKPTKVPKVSPTPKGRVTTSDSAVTKNYTVRQKIQPKVAGEQTAKIVAIADLPKQETGQLVKITGTVAQLNIFDTRLIYLSGSGVGIFLVSGEYPALSLGDEITVTGILAKPDKELFVSVVSPKDIKKGENISPPSPHSVEMSEINDGLIGRLIKTDGVVDNYENKTLVIKKGDKKITVMVNQDFGDIEIGKSVTVTGIVSDGTEGLRILGSTVEATKTGSEKSKKIAWSGSIYAHWKMTSAVVCFGLALLLSFALDFPFGRRRVVLAQTFLK